MVMVMVMVESGCSVLSGTSTMLIDERAAFSSVKELS